MFPVEILKEISQYIDNKFRLCLNKTISNYILSDHVIDINSIDRYSYLDKINIYDKITNLFVYNIPFAFEHRKYIENTKTTLSPNITHIRYNDCSTSIIGR